MLRASQFEVGLRTMIARKHFSSVSKFLSLCAVTLLSGCHSHMALLDPKGPIGAHEKSLIITSFTLMMIVVIPVFFLAFYLPWKYRASNKRAPYAPKWAHSTKIELLIWLVPALIIVVLGDVVWTSTHELSPFRPLASKKKPINIEAVALDWKWLFIYPDQHIATVNHIEFPTGVPVNFRITSDTVMTSFFIPRLGSQIYAMAGMQTEDHLQADEPGVYTGRNAQFSGPGFSSMSFKAVATSREQFERWVNRVKQTGTKLDLTALKRLEKPSEGDSVTYYSDVVPHLFDTIINKYMNANVTSKKDHA